jgi:hypothetical protein
MVEFGGVIASKSDSNIVDDDGVSIDHPAPALQQRLRLSTASGWDEDEVRLSSLHNGSVAYLLG